MRVAVKERKWLYPQFLVRWSSGGVLPTKPNPGGGVTQPHIGMVSVRVLSAPAKRNGRYAPSLLAVSAYSRRLNASGREGSDRDLVHAVGPREAEPGRGDHPERDRRLAGDTVPEPNEVGRCTVHDGG